MSPGKALFHRIGNIPLAVLMPVTPQDRPVETPLPDPALREVLDSFQEPALLYLPGGRVAAANHAAEQFSDVSVVGMSVDALLDRNRARRADGSPVLRGDLPYARALRGEIVAHGDRLELTLPDGSSYSALITSIPIVRDGKVVAALSVWHDFEAYAHLLAADRLPSPYGPAPGA